MEGNDIAFQPVNECYKSTSRSIPKPEKIMPYWGNECILGTDDPQEMWEKDRRSQVKDPQTFPYNTTFMMQITFRDPQNPDIEYDVYGSGFMSGKGVAITAAHNIFDLSSYKNNHDDQRLEPYCAKEIWCHFGAHRDFQLSKEKSLDRRKVVGYVFHQKFAHKTEDTQDICYDYALLFFDDDLYDNVSKNIVQNGFDCGIGVFGLSAGHMSDKAFTFGYPDSAGIHTVNDHPKDLRQKKVKVLGIQYFHEEKILPLPENYKEMGLCSHRNIVYKMDTTGGQSGSPVVIQDPRDPKQHHCVGIHTGRVVFKKQAFNLNRGIAINKSLIQEFVGWIEAFKRVNPAQEKFNKKDGRFSLTRDPTVSACILRLEEF